MISRILALLLFVVFVSLAVGEVRKTVTQKLDKEDVLGEQTVGFKYGDPIKVQRVIDGDTLELENGERLRYIGIDTPETSDPRKPVQCFAKEAAQRNRELVEGKNIRVYKDVTEKDYFGRYLGYAYLENGELVNSVLVKEGYAFASSYPPDTEKQTYLYNSQQEARSKSLGLWKSCRIETNKSGRLQTSF